MFAPYYAPYYAPYFAPFYTPYYVAPTYVFCPYCGHVLTWVPEYRKWYCYFCRRYV